MPFLLVALTVTSIQIAVPADIVAALPACRPAQLAWSFDAENGAFDGLSQTGTLMVVRNLGSEACRTTPRPRLVFADARGHAVAFVARVLPGMHPGPVMTPIGIAAGAEATAVLHWVMADVYAGHNCVATSKVAIGADAVGAPFVANACGPADKPVPFDQAALRTDPIIGNGVVREDDEPTK